MKPELEVGIIIFSILIWVSAWQLLPIIIGKMEESISITIYLLIILVSILFLWLLYDKNEEDQSVK